jgi:hypothetical protein
LLAMTENAEIIQPVGADCLAKSLYS